MSKAGALNPMQARFVAEYLVDLNATEAAIRAGYSKKTARQIGSRLLTNIVIAEAIQAGQAKLLQKVEVTAERVIAELARIAFSDVRGLFDADTGKLRDLGDLTEDMARAVASIEVSRERSTRRVKGGEDEEDTVESLVKVRIWDKPRALELLARNLGMLRDKVEHSGEVNVIKTVQHVHED